MSKVIRSNEALNTEVDLKAPLDSPALINPTINGVAQSGYSGFKNYIINGKKVVNQRSLTSTDNSYNQDRWYKSGNNWTQGIEYLSLTPNVTYTISWVGSATCTYVFSTDSTLNNSWDNVGTMVSVANGGTITAPIDVFSGGKHLFIRFSSDATGSTFNFVQLEEGSVATPFENRPYGLELSLCQRYYEALAPVSVMFPWSSGTQVVTVSSGFSTAKRVVPTVAMGARTSGSGVIGAALITIYGVRYGGGGAATAYATYDAVTASAEL